MERFQLINEGQGLYKVLDLVNEVSISFEECRFHETQKFSLEGSTDMPVQDVIRVCREMSDYITTNYYDISMSPVVDHRKRIGDRIAEIRSTRNLTQQQLADKIGTNQGNIARIEGGKYSTTFDMLQRIAEALGGYVEIIDPDEFGEDELY